MRVGARGCRRAGSRHDGRGADGAVLREEAKALKPITGISSFQALRELTRKVQADCAIEVDGNAYSVPWRLIGERVRVTIAGGVLRIHHAGREVAVHPREVGRRQRLVDPAHFEGVAGFRAKRRRRSGWSGCGGVCCRRAASR